MNELVNSDSKNPAAPQSLIFNHLQLTDFIAFLFPRSLDPVERLRTRMYTACLPKQSKRVSTIERWSAAGKIFSLSLYE